MATYNELPDLIEPSDVFGAEPSTDAGYARETFTLTLISGDVVGSRFFGSSINSAFVEIGIGGSSNLADFGVFRGGSESYPVFSVYDNLTTIDLRVGGGNNTPLSFLTVEVDTNITRTYGTWDFLGATVTNLGNYMTSSAVQAAISNAIAQHIIDYH